MKNIFIALFGAVIALIFAVTFIKVKEFSNNETNDIVIIDDLNVSNVNKYSNETIESFEVAKKYLHMDALSPDIVSPMENNTNISYNWISIVIDDTGNTLKYIDEYFNLAKKFNITFSILPDSHYASRFANLAHENGIEVMLHMPMEADISFGEKTVIKTDMNADEIAFLLNYAFSKVPYAKGLNNHTGSVATKDASTVGYMLKYLKENDKYFLDSYTTAHSVVYDLAITNGVKTAKRSVFLDNSHNYEDIMKQWETLISLSKRDGGAIAIGHYQNRETLDFLEKNIVNLVKEGIVTVNILSVLQLK